MKRFTLAAALAAASLAAGSAEAAKMVAPVSVSTDAGDAGRFWTVDNIIDQSGLPLSYEPGVTEFEDYVTDLRHNDSLNTRWLSRSGTSGATLTFDFGKVVRLGKLALWDDHSTTNSLFRFSTPELLDFASFRPIDAVKNPGPPPQVFDFRDVTTRYLTVSIEGCNAPGTNFTGCGVQEMAFAEGIAGGVPEPTTWALMILGFGAAGAVLRRRTLAAA
jgi:hypothetical protein